MGCRKIGKELELHPAHVWKIVNRMGIVRSKKESITRVSNIGTVSNTGTAPFKNQTGLAPNGSLAVIKAMEWFLERGYMVSVPIEPAPYDLIVESEAGLKKIQVKSAGQKSRYGVWHTKIARKYYDRKKSPSSNGKTVQAPYSPNDIDFFFIQAGDGVLYLIPRSVTGEKVTVYLNHVYQEFRV